ncbi:glucose-6-phosphate isomerase, cytosolic 2B-like [Papaver somniferum]|uniref:glucose-6-phosphate isomerase, cytosolic 2B-like n=1 Tax=Papaver somniferum TaxID=3469 RepID=UPI000E6FD9DB|nr:glucose-6-phosphate isomerase, cytosolic 2B-like [Papaver somniferum]XP_026446293.1 glucose-6-phosphate isomerase, cytosolic 2B-like [Papaver somniferum]
MRVTKVVSIDLSVNPGDWYFLIRRSAIMAILPYCQALEKFAPHIQQVSMETKGKGVSIDGVPLPFEEGEIDFGESDSNDQHRFYQLIHQGRVIPCDFIGVVKSQQPVYLKGATLTTVPLRVNVLSKGLSYKEL